MTSPGEFFSQGWTDLETLAAEQGVSPVDSLDELRGDFWPEDEAVDHFIAVIRGWRSEGGRA